MLFEPRRRRFRFPILTTFHFALVLILGIAFLVLDVLTAPLARPEERMVTRLLMAFGWFTVFALVLVINYLRESET